MKTSTEIYSAARHVGEKKAVALLGKAGFDAWDFSMFEMARWDWENGKIFDTPHVLKTGEYLKFARELKSIGQAYGMVCNQSHAPFPTQNMPLDTVKRAIELTAEAGGQICVVHPHPFLNPKENAEFYAPILEFGKEYGVTVATENMWAWDREKDESSFAACATAKDFCEVIDLTGENGLVACLDIGHAEMRGSGDGAANMIRALGSRLQALHIHDNDRWHDSHQIPFSMQIDFSEVAKALKDIGYSGYLTLEADAYLNAYTDENLFEGVKKLLESVKKIGEMME